MASAMSLMIKQHIYIYLKVQFLGRCQIVQSAKDKKQKITLSKKRVRKVTNTYRRQILAWVVWFYISAMQMQKKW